jgi:hypothetical protein
MLKHLKIRDSLFWDIDQKQFSEDKNRTLIIERVLNYGNISEWIEIVKYYGLPVIRQEVKKAGDLDPKTMAFIETYLHIPKSRLKCYTRKLLMHLH